MDTQFPHCVSPEVSELIWTGSPFGLAHLCRTRPSVWEAGRGPETALQSLLLYLWKESTVEWPRMARVEGSVGTDRKKAGTAMTSDQEQGRKRQEAGMAFQQGWKY